MPSSLSITIFNLEGVASNREGFGSVVRVRTGDQTWTQVYNGKSGYLSQSSYPLYFGLGDADTADAITVEWPSGKKQVVSGPIPSNQLVRIVEEPGAPEIERPARAEAARTSHGHRHH